MKKWTIVLIDDEIWTLISLKKLFHRPDLGFEVLQIFQDSSTALSFINENHPDFIFLDIKMPGVNGIELAQQFKLLHIPSQVVIISAFADFEYAQQAIKQGVLDYLVKPVTMDKADQLLKELSSLEKNDSRTDADIAPDTQVQDTFEEIRNYVREHYADRLQLHQIAQKFFLNESYCSTLFRNRLGVTFTKYLTDLRMDQAVQLLSETSIPIKNISISVGYPDYLYFSRLFRKRFGMSPSEYRETHRGKMD